MRLGGDFQGEADDGRRSELKKREASTCKASTSEGDSRLISCEPEISNEGAFVESQRPRSSEASKVRRIEDMYISEETRTGKPMSGEGVR